MKQYLKISLLMCLLTSSLVPALSRNQKACLGGGVVLVTATAIWRIYPFIKRKIQECIDAKIINEATNAIVLALTSNTTINDLPEAQREQALRNKAQLIQRRIRLIKALEPWTAEASLSQAHRQKIARYLQGAKITFGAIDLVREQNPYETEYVRPSTFADLRSADRSLLTCVSTNMRRFDTLIENQILASVVLNLKPKNECTPAEIVHLEAARQRTTKIIESVTQKLRSTSRAPYILLKALVPLLTKA